MSTAPTMDTAGGPHALETSVVGKPHPHDSAAKHVQGSAAYIDDIPTPVGCLHIAVGGTEAAALGTITRLDLSAVESAPGVIAVLTAKDIPGVNDCSPGMGDDPVFADGKLAFAGQVVFAVVAETRAAARRAVRLAVIDVAADTPAVTVDQAEARGTDLLPPYVFRKGDAPAALTRAPRRLSGSLRIGGQEHFYLEGQVALAIPGEDGDMHVLSSTQHPSEVQQTVSHVLDLPDAAVVCECRRMGGGFGGKESQAAQWAAIAALGARVTGRACKLRLDRDDDMRLTGKRHDFRVDWEVGFDDDGHLQAVDVEFLARCGYSADLSLGVNDRTMFHADNAYEYPAALIRSRRLRTDTVSNTAFRGFGGPQGMLFSERMMDAVAITMGVDPLEIRKRNFYGRDGGVTPYGMRVEDNIVHELVAELETSVDYAGRRRAIREFNGGSPVLKKGLALNPVKFGISFTLKHLNQGGALVHVYTDGSIRLNHGGTEMGQGLNVKVAQVVAESFGVALDRVRITATDTAKVPNTSPTAASSGADINGMAALNACEAIKGRLVAFAMEKWGVPADAVVFRDGQVLVGNEAFSFGDFVRQAYLARISLSEAGYYATPKITWNRDTAEGRPFLYFAYGAAYSEVTIDTLTGEMRIDRVDILHDVGRSLNPAVDIGQIEGGFVQGMGWLTTEELVYDDKGRLRTHAPSTYKIPTATDVPEHFQVQLWRNGWNREATIFRSKAVGEPPLMLATSVFSAATDAIASLRPGKVPPLDAPATAESILRAVKAMTMED